VQHELCSRLPLCLVICLFNVAADRLQHQRMGRILSNECGRMIKKEVQGMDLRVKSGTVLAHGYGH
jgi:hypothetical protein